MNMAAGPIALIVVVAVMAIARPSLAQEFREWVSKQDLFAANFPGEPVMTTITWTTEHGAQLPARVYTATRGPRTYSVTAVDYNQVKDILIAKAKQCPPGLERCNGLTSFSGEGYWKSDLRGAMIYAAFRIMKRDVTVTHYMWNYLGGQAIEANELQFTNNKDQSRAHVTIYMHHNRLYIMEETAPASYPAPGLFVQSMSLREPDGTEANHQRMYFNAPEVDPTETNEFYGRGRGGGPR
jgi:hypothetical protein